MCVCVCTRPFVYCCARARTRSSRFPFSFLFLARPTERGPPVSSTVLHRPWPFCAPIRCQLVCRHHSVHPSVHSFVTTNYIAVFFTLRRRLARLACVRGFLFFFVVRTYASRLVVIRSQPRTFSRTPIFL